MATNDELLQQAMKLARERKFDDARRIAMQVYKEQPNSTNALWIIVRSTASNSERRNALNHLLRLSPDDVQARLALEAMDREAREPAPQPTANQGGSAVAARSSVIRPLAQDAKPNRTVLVLYGIAVAALVILLAAIVLYLVF
ncbi:MAG: hypothetical protein HC828_12500 [Blastochloris sp.]|nr:hypothetical protein [Blastochloris sp.]